MEKIKNHVNELKRIDSQRKKWLFLSMFVSFSVVGMIFEWEYIHTHRLVWVLTSIGLLVSVCWWYWSMRLIRHLINFKIVESEILGDIVKGVRVVQTDVQKVVQEIDNYKK